jgi:hypothetical protein
VERPPVGSSTVRAFAAVVSAAALAPLTAGAQPVSAPTPATTVTLRGLGGQAVALAAADLARLPHQHVSLTHVGETADYAGPELATLLRQVDAPLGAHMHGRAVTVVVMVSASDGYRAALSLGEIDPELHPGARVILADQEDGHALAAGEAPFRLVIAGDARPARDVRSVTAIELRQLP